jgi:tRNA(Arg) A34 adenosine deaminase TadA
MNEDQVVRDEQDLMRLAIQRARQGIAAGQSPFGSVLAREGIVVAATHNTVRLDTDPTAHAEVNCLRAAAHQLQTIDLSGCVLYSTCEPCPMCLGAIHWAKVDRVCFGATIGHAARAGFAELQVAAASLASLGKSRLIVEGDCLADECAQLFDDWLAQGLSAAY